MANATERAIRRKRKRDAKPSRTPSFPRSNKKNHHPKPQRRPIPAPSNPNLTPLGDNALLEAKAPTHNTKKQKKDQSKVASKKEEPLLVSALPATQQLRFFLGAFQSAGGFRLSSLELEAFKESSFVELSVDASQDAGDLCRHVRGQFGRSWKEELCSGEAMEGTIQPGSPAVLVVCASAIRALELLRGLRKLTRDCKPAKLFAKHMKVDEQVQFLKNRVNIASGTPSRIKKLIDVDALGLSRMATLVLDMQRDAKGFSLFTLPQVCDEFWELYKSHLHQRLLQSELRICFYGSTSVADFEKSLKSAE